MSSDTTWKVSKYGVASGSYFPALELNTDQKKLRICTLSCCVSKDNFWTFSMSRIPYPKIDKSYYCVKSVRIRIIVVRIFRIRTENRKIGVFLRIQSECRKMRTRITPHTENFHAVYIFMTPLPLNLTLISKSPFLNAHLKKNYETGYEKAERCIQGHRRI